MGGYHNVVLPETWSQGSVFGIGFDTRINVLESGQEYRLARGLPWGRRRYSVNIGIRSTTEVLEFYKFFILRQGALNSFKMKDWQDYATTPSGTTHLDDDEVTAFDVQLVPGIGDRVYQLVKRYTDSVRTITRIIEKPIPGTLLVAVNGSPTPDYTYDGETGEITISSSLDPITTVTAGFEFYTVVRFADSTDKMFQIALQSSQTASQLPGIELIEDLAARTVSQDYQYGGAYSFLGLNTDVQITEVNGRMQVLQPLISGLSARLPSVLDVPLGGPIVVLHNITVGETMSVIDENLDEVTTLGPGVTKEFFLAPHADGNSRFWVAV